jgi:hypothetical protein
VIREPGAIRKGCPAQIAGEIQQISEELGQQHLRFVRRGVYCCSAVAGGSLALPSPSLGVSSLDLGRSSNVSGPFSLLYVLAVNAWFTESGPPVRNLFRGRPVGTQLLQRDFGQTVGERRQFGGEAIEGR